MGKKIIPCIIEQFEKDNNTFLLYLFMTNYKIMTA